MPQTFTSCTVGTKYSGLLMETAKLIIQIPALDYRLSQLTAIKIMICLPLINGQICIIVSITRLFSLTVS